jgi:PIN domain nuclease of toxin-antitoxin system
MTRLLLDTSVVIWALTSPERLKKTVRSALAASQNETLISMATPFEMAVKISVGKLEPPGNAASLEASLELAREELGLKFLPITVAHTGALARLPLLHRDPFDRLLIAQALSENCTLVTSDRVFALYPGLSVMPT